MKARPVRGTPEETRARLVAAAAEVFERDGYTGTDSNRLARAAGYAPGTFYKHFADKRELFLAVYEEWVTREWAALAPFFAAFSSSRGGRGPRSVAASIVDVVLEHHRRFRGLRASLRALVATDDTVRAFYQAQRTRQLEWLGQRRAARRVADALALFTLERAADALADGEAEALGLPAVELRAALIDLVEQQLEG